MHPSPPCLAVYMMDVIYNMPIMMYIDLPDSDAEGGKP
jgi:hypothetical protein